MKALIATTCVVIIATTGYFFIQEYRAASREAQLIRCIDFGFVLHETKCDELAKLQGMRP